MIKNKETNEIFSVQIHFQRGKTAFKSRSSIVWWHVMKDFLNLDYPSTGNVEAESCDLDNELSIQSDNVQSFVTIKNIDAGKQTSDEVYHTHLGFSIAR